MRACSRDVDCGSIGCMAAKEFACAESCSVFLALVTRTVHVIIPAIGAAVEWLGRRLPPLVNGTPFYNIFRYSVVALTGPARVIEVLL